MPFKEQDVKSVCQQNKLHFEALSRVPVDVTLQTTSYKQNNRGCPVSGNAVAITFPFHFLFKLYFRRFFDV